MPTAPVESDLLAGKEDLGEAPRVSIIKKFTLENSYRVRKSLRNTQAEKLKKDDNK